MQSRKTMLCLIPRKLHWKIIYLLSGTGNFRLGIHTTREISRIVIRLSIIAIGFYHLAWLQHKPMGQVSSFLLSNKKSGAGETAQGVKCRYEHDNHNSSLQNPGTRKVHVMASL